MSKDHSGCTHSPTKAAIRACEVGPPPPKVDREAWLTYEFYVGYATAKGYGYGEWHKPDAFQFLEERFGVQMPETDRLRLRINRQLIAAGWIETRGKGVPLRLVSPEDIGYDPLLRYV